MAKSVDETKRMEREDFKDMLAEYAPKVAVAAMTGYFTWHAAWFLTEDKLLSWMTVALAEGFLLLWQYLRDEDAENEIQTKNAVFGWRASIFFVAITDASSGIFMAHNAGFEAFATIPAWAEIAPALFIPLMAVVQGIIVATYTGNSDSRKEFMDLRKDLRHARYEEKKAVANAQKEVSISNAKRMAELAKENAPVIGKAQAESKFTKQYGNVMALDVDDAINPTLPKQHRSKK